MEDMPTPAQTSLAEIVRAGRDVIEAGGLDALTMNRVAASVGVRAPSLYKRLQDRDELVRLVAEDVACELASCLDAAATTGDPSTDLRALLAATRDFAHRNAEGYALVYARLPQPARPDREVLARASAAVLRTTAVLAGEEQSLPAARTLVAWLHGFVTMELAGAFRLGGDVDSAFEYGVDRLVDAVTSGVATSDCAHRERYVP